MSFRSNFAEPLWRQDHEDGYTRLARAVIANAADSLVRAVYTVEIVDKLMIDGPDIKNMMSHYHGAHGAISENEYFFRSDWYVLLAENSGFHIDGEDAIRACRKKAHIQVAEDLALDVKELRKKYKSHRYKYR